MNALFIGFAVYVIASIVCSIVNKIPRTARKTKTAQKPIIEISAPKAENALAIVSNDYFAKDDIKKQCLTEQILFVEDLISSESNPEKTLKYMKEKQRILTALADL